MKHLDEQTTQVIAMAAEQRSLLDAESTETITSFFGQPIPEQLWHYTSLAALKGILSSGRVWATEARSTTDASEFDHARDVALAYLERLEPKSEAEKRAKRSYLQIISEEFSTGSLSADRAEIFISSFSAAPDLKSQWTEYAANGAGVSIAFDLRNVRPPAELQVAVTLAPCVYKQKEKEQLLEATLAHYTNEADRMYQETGDLVWAAARLHDWRLVDDIYGLPFRRKSFDEFMDDKLTKRLRAALTLTKYDLLRVASHCKNDWYEEEKEWRLVLPHTKGMPLTDSVIEYRGPKKNIPYIAHHLFSTPKLPISEILAGPFCNRDELKAILDEFEYQVPISVSRAPIRRPEDI